MITNPKSPVQSIYNHPFYTHLISSGHNFKHCPEDIGGRGGGFLLTDIIYETFNYNEQWLNLQIFIRSIKRNDEKGKGKGSGSSQITLTLDKGTITSNFKSNKPIWSLYDRPFHNTLCTHKV